MRITLKTLGQATEQQVFDKVVLHLRKQHKQSMSDNSVNGSLCMYRAGDLMCAAGCLIADDEYDTSMERNSWGRLIERGVVMCHLGQLICSLQQIHDVYLPGGWCEALSNLARARGLDDRLTRVSSDFLRMCSIGHGCGLTTLGEAFTQVERHYDALWPIDQANTALNKLHDEVQQLGGPDVTIVSIMGEDWAALEDEEMAKAMAGGDQDDDIDLSID